ncbi:two-component sensor histidine kinase [Rhizocola hellebori]|uniref:histidine kinase n=1 Tax=Rhizocola hellebori TaxID=1392758 RepID=A0A8J3VF48_9ACTN|nr:HAMP domain-containing sensor histidine kinase [Rhizocola hellebori]GIH03583.1 two-component sensor histidine kinase [Rhizocola hellebori]
MSRARDLLSRWGVGGIRLRSALAAAAVVSAAAALAGVLMVYSARSSLTANIDATASQRSGQVAAAITSGDEARLAQTLRPAAGDQTIVQVLDQSGQVVACSPAITGLPPITDLRPAAGQTLWQQGLLPSGDDPFRIVATSVPAGAGSRIVVVGQSLQPVEESLEVVTDSFLAGIPLLALAVGLATFVFVSRSLRAVEAIRGRVATITARDLRARVPVPRARDEVAALAETMNAMLDRLQAASDTQRRFVADASHELRSPLTTLQVGLDVLAAGDEPPPGVQRLRIETGRLGRLVADLLLLARADEHGLRPRDADVDLDDIAYSHRERLHRQYPHLLVEAHIAAVRVPGDAHQLERAVGNLCDNAAQHARTLVTVEVWQEQSTAHLIVADDGPGIDPADRERVFGRFVRLDTSRSRNVGGSGLGLAITREIARGHHGTIAVETSPGGGAALHLRLPTIGHDGHRRGGEDAHPHGGR